MFGYDTKAVGTYADALLLAGVDYLVVGPKVLEQLDKEFTMQGYNDGMPMLYTTFFATYAFCTSVAPRGCCHSFRPSTFTSISPSCKHQYLLAVQMHCICFARHEPCLKTCDTLAVSS